MKPTSRNFPNLCILSAALLSGCASQSLEEESRIGQAVVGARQEQTLYRTTRMPSAQPVMLSGNAAKASMDRYQQSFEAPPPPVYGLNFGVVSPAGHAPSR